MAALTIETILRTGLDPTLVAAGGSGDTLKNTGREYFHVQNDSGGELTVTIDLPATIDGQSVTNPTVTVPTSTFKLIGPFPKSYQDTNGLVKITYSTSTSVEVAALKL